MKQQTWYYVFGKGPAHDKPILLAKVRSPGLSHLFANTLRENGYTSVNIYTNEKGKDR